jgi:DNA-binding MarR family transcriptional regulator
MQDKLDLHQLVIDTMQAFGPFYREAMRQAIDETGVPNTWFILYRARGADPQPLSLERCAETAPYANPERLSGYLEELVKEECLERVGEDVYILTDLGRKNVERPYQVAQANMADLEYLPKQELEQLNGLLWRIVEASLLAPEPENKWHLRASRKCDPGDGVEGALKTDQYLTDLVIHRDDVHPAAWRPYGVSGRTWETLTLIWNGEATTAAKVLELREGRGYTEEEFGTSLKELVELGWIKPGDEGYQMTEKGRKVRQEAEDTTNQLYFAPWDTLSEEELEQLSDLLARAKAGLEELAEGLEQPE